MKRKETVCLSRAIAKPWWFLALRHYPNSWWRTAAALCILVCAGCATKTVVRKPIFYPPAPDEPRVQYLTSFSTSADIEPRPSWLLTFLTGYKGEAKPLLKPYGVALANDRIFVCDTAQSCLCVFDLARRSFSYLIPQGPGALTKPINVNVDAEGNLYVADSERRRIVKLDAQGKYLSAIAGGEEFKPVAVVTRGNKGYVADTQRRKVHVFDLPSSKRLFSIPAGDGTNPPAPGTTNSPESAVGSNTVPPHADSSAEDLPSSLETNQATGGDSNLYMPINLAVDQEENIYVTDAAAFRVQVYDREGRHIRSIGTHGSGFGEFARPKGIGVDRSGRLYVVDAAEEVVQVFDVKTGAILMYFGEPAENEASLSLPAGIHIDYDAVRHFQKYADPGFELEHLILVTSQFGSPRISVYGFGHKKK